MQCVAGAHPAGLHAAESHELVYYDDSLVGAGGVRGVHIPACLHRAARGDCGR